MRVCFVLPSSKVRRLAVVTSLLAATVVAAPAVGRAPLARATPVEDVQSAPSAQEALEIAGAFGHDVAITDETTATSTSVAHADGSTEVTQWSDPVRVQHDDGTWVDVDTSLEPSDGVLVPKESPSDVAFSAGGDGPLAVVHTSSGSPISIAWSKGSLPTPTINASSATYTEVLPGVDLRLTATVTGISEVLVVKTPTAMAATSLDDVGFAVDGANVAGDASGTVTATAADGSTLKSPPAAWWDSDGGGTADGPGGFGSGVPLDVTVHDDTLTVDASEPALQPELRYPVFVDPEFSVAQVNRTFTDNAYPDQSYWNGAGASDAYQHVGYINAGNSDDGRSHVTRSYWQMPTAKYGGRVVTEAHLNTSLMWSSSCAKRDVSLYSSSAISSGTTWNHQPVAYVLQDTQPYAAGYSSSCAATTVRFDATEALQSVAASRSPNLYLMLQANESDWLAWKKFGANVAIVVTYHTTPTFSATADATCARVPGLIPGDTLNPGEVRWSDGGAYFLDMQTDGNLVLYDAATAHQTTGAHALWASHTFTAGAWAVYQTDGNLVIRRPSDGGAIWNIGGDAADPGESLVVQEDGNLVSYNDDGLAKWNSGTAQGGTITAVCYSHEENHHVFTATATANGIADANGNYQRESVSYEIELRYADQDLFRQMGTFASGTPARYDWTPFGVNRDTNYDWRVKACAATTTACTWSHWKRTFKYNPDEGIEKPTITASGDLSLDTEHGYGGPIGTAVETITFTPPTTHNYALKTPAYGYAYAVLAGDGAAGGSNPGPSTNVGCGNRSGVAGFTMICGDAVTKPLTISVAAVDYDTVVELYAYDKYGNAPGTPVTLTLHATEDTANYQRGHSWATGAAAADCARTAVADTAAQSPSSLALNSGVCRQTTTNPPYVSTTYPFSDMDLHYTTNGLATTGAAVADVGSTAVVSAGGWFYPTVDGAAASMTALSVRGTNEGLLNLQIAGGKWRLCTPFADGDSFYGSCVTNSAAITKNTWYFVVGTYDSVNNQIRLYVGVSNGHMPTPAISVHQSALPSSVNGRLDVGGNLADGATTLYWKGEIDTPFVVPTALSTDQYLARSRQQPLIPPN